MNAYHARRHAFTLLELLVVTTLLMLLFGYLFVRPFSSRCGPISKRLLCTANLKGIGTSMKIYANDNDEHWPVPAFDETRIGMIDYTVSVGGGEGSVRSPDRSQPSIGGAGGARQLSTTRSFWILVRSGDVTVKQFICPTSGDTPDTTKNLDEFYDFQGYGTVSYGFQVPFGPRSTRAIEGMDNRMVLAADKGPYYTDHRDPDWNIGGDGLVTTQDPPQSWRRFNSPNHGGVGNGEGQNCLFADGHASFQRTPIAGVDHDNIYTVALDNQSLSGRIYGESPWKRSAHPFAPSVRLSNFSSTDTAIFP